MRAAVLKALREKDGYVSGQEICDALNVSRTAVWKDIKKLKEDGYEIESVSNRGYRLVLAPDIITEYEIYSLLDTKWAGSELHYFSECDSTNTQAKRLADGDSVNGTLVVTENQYAGRGRRGRTWLAPEKANIAMTLLLKPEYAPDRAPMVTLVAALAVAAAINEKYNANAQIKWPNDIVIGGRKVCGILTEMSAEIDYINYVVIGVGINIHQQEFAEEIKDIAGTVDEMANVTVRRAELIAEFLKQFEKYYELFCEKQDLSGIRKDYERLLVNFGKQVRVLDPKEPFEGKARGINDRGELIVDTWESRKLVSSGEVSVRGLYGYV